MVLAWAARILRGGVFYRDLDAYQLPGASYLLALWMRCFGEDLAAARGLAALVFCALVATLYACALRLLDRRRAALFALALLALKLLARPAFTAYLYSDLALLFACLAILLLLGRDGALRLLGAGLCTGLALVSKQNLGTFALLGGAWLLAWPDALARAPRPSARQRWLGLGSFAAGAAVPLVALVLYCAAEGVLGRMLVGAFVRPFASYLPTSGISFLVPLDWSGFGELRELQGFPYLVDPLWTLLMRRELPGAAWYPLYWTAAEVFTRLFYASVPVAFLAALVRRIRGRGQPASPREQRLFAFALLAFAVTLSAFPRADFFHVASVYPVVLLLGFALRTGASEGAARTRAAALAGAVEAAAVGLLLVVCLALAVVYHGHMSHRLRLAKAELWIHPELAWVEPVVRYVREQVGPDQRLFVHGHEAYYYFFTERSSPWHFPQLYPGQTGEGGGASVVAALERDPPTLVLRGVQSWPGLPQLSQYAPALASFVEARFEADPRFLEPQVLGAYAPPPRWVLEVLRPVDAR